MYECLKTTINTIKIIDDHGHPGCDAYFSKLPHEQRIPFMADAFKTPEESCGGFPYLRELHYEAYEKFYGFERAAIQDPAQREVLSQIYDEKRRDLSRWIDHIMEQSGVELLMANFVIPDDLKNKPNIRFVPSVDPLVFPFNNNFLKERTLGRYFINYFEYVLKKLQQQYDFVDSGFESYLNFVDKVLNGYLQDQAAAFKFTIAYARNTYFEKIDSSQGPKLYEDAKKGDEQAYTKLQDLLVWHILRRIVEADMAVQFHFAITDNYVEYFDPLSISNIIADEALKNAKIVILHGGYPRYGNAQALALGGLTPNNVCIDISGRIMFANHPKIIAKMLRSWLECPVLWDKIIYGSDVLWGERYIYTCARTGRDAVYYALSGMLDDDIIDEETAVIITRKILRENALRIYNLPR